MNRTFRSFTIHNRANTLDGTLLVNGAGKWIDLEEPENAAEAEMKKNSSYRALLATRPKAIIFPGDRGDGDSVKQVKSPGSEKSFSVAYILLDGCHACGQLATVWFQFNFDAKKQFPGSSFQKIVLTPADNQ